MRVLCISDTHGRPPAPRTLPPADILIHAGDATMRGSPDEWADFKAWLANCPHPHKVFLPGNHDVHCPTYLGPNVQIAHDTLIEIGVTAEAVVLRLWKLLNGRRVSDTAKVRAAAILLQHLGSAHRVAPAAVAAAERADQPGLEEADVVAFSRALGIPLEEVAA